ncbi:hypothetical protein DUNSADRAFT_15736 [Dunaliella salina]|uniref:Uncharacterized protein n=1 Tax=Dunaliella salina TaxID=3046 RepID=A0ABQ7H9B9_DUNSA|nr:hypothetical protein DUNSADRAFT_15736 [Dunaliella salina]|eukprot:KAF5843441.1 hypothetical protein DUNSADRAFT_15736 [Dunaliella salina]
MDDAVHLGPEVLSLLYLPRTQAQHLWELQCLATGSSHPSSGSHRASIAPACAEEVGEQPPQLLVGALVLVHMQGSLKLRQVTQTTKAATLTRQQQQNQGPRCQLHLQGGQVVGLDQLDHRPFEQLPEKEICRLLCEHASWINALFGEFPQLPRQLVAETVHRMWSGLLCVKRATASLFGSMALSQKGHKEVCQQLQQPLPDHMQLRIARLPPYTPTLFVATLHAWVRIQTEVLTPSLASPLAIATPPVQALPTSEQETLLSMGASVRQHPSPPPTKQADERGTDQTRSSTPSTRTKRKKGWGPEPLSTGATAAVVASAGAADAGRVQPSVEGVRHEAADALPSTHAQSQLSLPSDEDYQALWRNELKCTDEALKHGDDQAAQVHAHSASQFRQKHELQKQQQQQHQAGTNSDLKPRRGGRETHTGAQSAETEEKRARSEKSEGAVLSAGTRAGAPSAAQPDASDKGEHRSKSRSSKKAEDLGASDTGAEGRGSNGGSSRSAHSRSSKGAVEGAKIAQKGADTKGKSVQKGTDTKEKSVRKGTDAKEGPTLRGSDSKEGQTQWDADIKGGPTLRGSDSKEGQTQWDADTKGGPTLRGSDSKEGQTQWDADSKGGLTPRGPGSKEEPARKGPGTKGGPTPKGTDSKMVPALRRADPKEEPTPRAPRSKEMPVQRGTDTKEGLTPRGPDSREGPIPRAPDSKEVPVHKGTDMKEGPSQRGEDTHSWSASRRQREEERGEKRGAERQEEGAKRRREEVKPDDTQGNKHHAEEENVKQQLPHQQQEHEAGGHEEASKHIAAASAAQQGAAQGGAHRQDQKGHAQPAQNRDDGPPQMVIKFNPGFKLGQRRARAALAKQQQQQHGELKAGLTEPRLWAPGAAMPMPDLSSLVAQAAAATQQEQQQQQQQRVQQQQQQQQQQAQQQQQQQQEQQQQQQHALQPQQPPVPAPTSGPQPLFPAPSPSSAAASPSVPLQGPLAAPALSPYLKDYVQPTHASMSSWHAGVQIPQIDHESWIWKTGLCLYHSPAEGKSCRNGSNCKAQKQPAPPPLPELALQPGALNPKIASLREKLEAQKQQNELAEAAARAAGTAAPTVEERPLYQKLPAFASPPPPLPPHPPPSPPPAPAAAGGAAPDGLGHKHHLPPLPSEPYPTSDVAPPLPPSDPPQAEATCAPEPPPAEAQELGPVFPFPPPESPPNSSLSHAPEPEEPAPPGLGPEPSSATAGVSAPPVAVHPFQPAAPPPLPASAADREADMKRKTDIAAQAFENHRKHKAQEKERKEQELFKGRSTDAKCFVVQ